MRARSILRPVKWSPRSLVVALVLGTYACSPGRGAAPPSKAPTTAAHPLVFGIYARDARDATSRTDEAHFFQKLAERPFVLVGEKHDNVDHHAFEARVIAALGKSSPRAVVLEHFRDKDQAKLDAFFAKPGARAVDLPSEVGWDPGWGEFAPFEAIFSSALAHRMPLVAGNFDRLDVRGLKDHPESAFSAEVRAELTRVVFEDGLEKALVDELSASHCGQLPPEFLAPMALAQHARDAKFSLAMRAGRTSSVLLAGHGHTRADRGVPRFLPKGSYVTVAMVEIDESKVAPSAYEELSTHDYVYFAPKAPADEDPCAAFRHPKPKSVESTKGPS